MGVLRGIFGVLLLAAFLGILMFGTILVWNYYEERWNATHMP